MSSRSVRPLDHPLEATDAAGLVDLVDAPLGPDAAARLETAIKGLRGEPVWQRRKRAELHALLALEERAPRLSILELDARTEILLRLRFDAPVPAVDPKVLFDLPHPSRRQRRRAPADGPLRIAPAAVLTVHYPSAILTQPLSGIGVVTIREPEGVWHPNVSHDLQGKLCLGSSVVRGTPLVELVLMSYAALTLQSASLQPAVDRGGVMNSEAVCFWQERREHLPLTRDSILAPVRPVDEQVAAELRSAGEETR